VNGQIRDKTAFDRLYIQPAAYEGGTSLGAAYYVYHQVLGRPRQFVMDQSCWGPGYDDSAVGKLLESRGMRYIRYESPRTLCETGARHIAEGKVVGWFQGRMEWGPRALGNRSILVDPRRAEMKDVLNARVKHREAFRPFAPSRVEERTGEFFDQGHPSPFMLMTYRVKPSMRDRIPAVTHVDGTGRLQTVSRAMNPLFWSLIGEFDKVSGIPVILNTSFNENEPIVCTPHEALDCFLRTKMDVLVIGTHLIEEKPH
jgi:carbamoyltransferase